MLAESKTKKEVFKSPSKKPAANDFGMKKEWVPVDRAFDECSFTSALYGRTYKCETRMEQSTCDLYKGTYIARNIGMRFGGYFFVSYGGKNVACLRDKVAVPWSQDPVRERAMDLDQKAAFGTIRLANGQCAVSASTSAKGTNLMPFISAAMGLSWIFGPEFKVWFALAKSGLSAYSALNDDKYTGCSRARIEGFYSIFDADGGGGEVVPVKDAFLNKNNEEGPISKLLILTTDVKKLDTGEELIIWADLSSQTQLKALDTAPPGQVDTATAHVNYSLGTHDVRQKIRVRCIER